MEWIKRFLPKGERKDTSPKEDTLADILRDAQVGSGEEFLELFKTYNQERKADTRLLKEAILTLPAKMPAKTDLGYAQALNTARLVGSLRAKLQAKPQWAAGASLISLIQTEGTTSKETRALGNQLARNATEFLALSNMGMELEIIVMKWTKGEAIDHEAVKNIGANKGL